MTWLTWRLQRTEFLLLGLICAGLTSLLLATHAEVARLAGACTDFQCRMQFKSDGTTDTQIQHTTKLYSIAMQALGWFNFIPLIAALLLVLPFLSELESGTYRLAWTQSITRVRWAATRLAALAFGGIAFSLLFGLTFHWWSSPEDKYIGRLGQDTFDLRGVVPFGFTAFAIGMTLAIGVLLRRPGVTIALASFAYIAVRLPFNQFVLPRLMAPKTAIANFNNSGYPLDWFLSSYWVDTSGNRLSESQFQSLCPFIPSIGKPANGNALADCVRQNGLVQYERFQPASRFWTFQMLEAGIYIAAALVLFGFAAWYLMRRVE